MPSNRRSSNDRCLYGIGEWYGRSFIRLSGEERRANADLQHIPKRQRPPIPCPPRSFEGMQAICTKEGGVCSIRPYQEDVDTGLVTTVLGNEGQLCTTCPYRFYEQNMIVRWIGDTILGNPAPSIVAEVGFLAREDTSDCADTQVGREDVGRIDHVLIHPDRTFLRWCAVEMQAVYFSGASMQTDFRALTTVSDDALPFPAGRRRPDFRSSGPKRLMPQLQIKVPTLRRWGKKMCVVVNRAFFRSLGKMETVNDVSNCDIAWFVVRYDEDEAGTTLRPDFVHLTTLERAVEGLTAGNPVSLSIFEQRILHKISRLLPGQPIE